MTSYYDLIITPRDMRLLGIDGELLEQYEAMQSWKCRLAKIRKHPRISKEMIWEELLHG